MTTPRIEPKDFEQIPVFRETFLVKFSAPGDAPALRHIGRLLFDLTNEYQHYWPFRGEDQPRPELRAILADLRHLEGFAGPVYLGAHYPFAAGLAKRIRRVANYLDAALRTRRRF